MAQVSDVTTTTRWPGGLEGWILGALVAVTITRIAFAVVSGLQYDRGDFFATMPGAYARTLNPALWSSPDLAESWAYGRDVYLYGPTQYLTLAPLVAVFDTYRGLARFLLGAYGLLIMATVYVMWRAFADPRFPVRTGVALLASTWLYFPVLQAYAQREFEVVTLFLTACATYLLLQRRETVAGAVLAYITWFKFLPLGWFGLLAIRRWWGATAAFIGTSVLVAGVAHFTLGLERFGAVWELMNQELGEGSAASGLCADWQGTLHRYALVNDTLADVRWALCGFGDQWPGAPVALAYWGLLGMLAGVFALGFWRIERRGPLPDADERWRRTLEAGLVVTISSVYFYAHYYYLSMLIVPLNALLARYLTAGQTPWGRVAMWAAAYLLLAAFLMPPTMLSRIVGSDVWQLYMRQRLYFYGEMLLIGLVLWEYPAIRLPAVRPAHS